MRNKYKGMAYFENQALLYAELTELNLESLSNKELTEIARQSVLNRIYESHINQFLWLYNTGGPLDEVVRVLNMAWPHYLNLLENTLNNSLEPYDKFHITPIDKLKVFPLLVLSDPPREIVHAIFDFTNTVLNYAVDATETKEVDVAFDGFFVRFAEYFEYKPEKISSEILDVKICGMLNECFKRPNDKQGILVEYVNGWRNLDQKGYFYFRNAHKNPKNKYFSGYWCFLGAAVSKMLNIDDSPLADHPDYPYDLVHFKKSE